MAAIATKLEVAMREAELVDQAIKSLFLFSERVIALGTTILGAAVTTAVVQDEPVVLVALPFAVLAVFGYGIHLSTELFYLGGYRRYLEVRINDLVGERILYWESGIVPKYRRGLTSDGVILLSVIGGVVLLSLWLAVQEAWRSVSDFWVGMLFTGLGLAFAVVTIGWRGMTNAAVAGHELARLPESDSDVPTPPGRWRTEDPSS